MSEQPKATVIILRAGRAIQIGDCKTTFLVDSADTNGLYAALEHDLPFQVYK